jgi:hypothetical protein
MEMETAFANANGTRTLASPNTSGAIRRTKFICIIGIILYSGSQLVHSLLRLSCYPIKSVRCGSNGTRLERVYLNAKFINTIVKALRITNITANTVFDFAALGFIKK